MKELTPKETSLLALVPDDGTRVSTHFLIANFWAGKELPLNPRQLVVARMRSIMAKQARWGLVPKLHQGPRAGPKPAEFWKE